jgi:IclR family transcriptional regulator, acetate operon repressor
MPVKPSQSAARVLSALERIAQNQPLGVSDLARLLDTNIAAAQRDIATLAEQGWIRTASGMPAKWELTAHIHSVAQHAYGNHDLRRRARGALQALWKETGESVLLNVPDGNKFIVIDVLESPHYVRSAPPIGLVVAARGSATARAMLPYMTPAQQFEFLGEPPDATMIREFSETVARGYAVSRGDVFAGSTNIAAPIFEMDGSPIGVVLISVPNDRASAQEEARLGAMVLATASRLSRGPAPQISLGAKLLEPAD